MMMRRSVQLKLPLLGHSRCHKRVKYFHFNGYLTHAVARAGRLDPLEDPAVM